MLFLSTFSLDYYSQPFQLTIQLISILTIISVITISTSYSLLRTFRSDFQVRSLTVNDVTNDWKGERGEDGFFWRNLSLSRMHLSSSNFYLQMMMQSILTSSHPIVVYLSLLPHPIHSSLPFSILIILLSFHSYDAHALELLQVFYKTSKKV